MENPGNVVIIFSLGDFVEALKEIDHLQSHPLIPICKGKIHKKKNKRTNKHEYELVMPAVFIGQHAQPRTWKKLGEMAMQPSPIASGL